MLLASITILWYFFFFFLVTFNNFFIIPVVKENTRVKLALAIPAEIPIALVKEIILVPPLVADKTIRVLPILSKQQCIYSVFYSFSFNVKTSRMGSTKWNYHKDGVFSLTTLIFSKFNFGKRASYT